jgi:hypothetical protein
MDIVGVTELVELERGKVPIGVTGRTQVVLAHFFSRYFMNDDWVEAIAQRLESI